MVLFEGLPYPIDMLYLKVAGTKDVLSMPLMEALGILTNVSYDYRASCSKTIEAGVPYFVIKGDSDKEKNKIFVVSKAELIKRLQLDIYDDKFKITDLAVQPIDELLTTEVKTFIDL